MYDILIRGGTVVDGTGNPRFKADVAVAGGKVVKIAPEITEDAARVIDATGLIVSPGFIDGHTHSDLSLALGSDSWNHLEHGVTTQIAGQCGSSPTPYYEGALRGELDGMEKAEQERLIALCSTPKTFMEQARTVPSGTNSALFVGHGALRAHAMGYSDAKPTEAQMEDMRQMLTLAMEAGFLGYSSGLVYAPSVYGDTEELIELARVLRPYGGVYTSHIRGEGDSVVASVKEAIRVGEEGGVATVISHLKVMGEHNRGTSRTLLSLMEQANERGVPVYADQYPFTAGSAPLSSQIPPKYLVGGNAAMLERLRDPAIRQQINHSIFNEVEEFDSSIYYSGWEGVLVAGSPKNEAYVGKRITEIASETGKEPIDAFCDLLLENEGMGQGIYFSQVEEDMMHIMAHPLITAGSDWSDLRTRRDPEHVAGSHPRGTATMVRRLELTRDHGLRTLEDAVRSVTALTAQSVGLPGQGLLQEGRDANITIFDYAGLKAHADYIHPFRRNEGIHTVLVNGVVAVEEGRALGVRAGRMLKRGE